MPESIRVLNRTRTTPQRYTSGDCLLIKVKHHIDTINDLVGRLSAEYPVNSKEILANECLRINRARRVTFENLTIFRNKRKRKLHGL